MMAKRILISLSGVFSLALVFTINMDVSESQRAGAILAPSVDNCTAYNASEPCMIPGAQVYCLSNSTVLTGFCNAHEAVCRDNVTLDSTLSACGLSSGDNNNSGNDGTGSNDSENTAAVLQAEPLRYVTTSVFSAAITCVIGGHFSLP